MLKGAHTLAKRMVEERNASASGIIDLWIGADGDEASTIG